MPQHARIICPECGHGLQVPPEHLGRQGHCRYCGHAFLARADGGSSPPAPWAATRGRRWPSVEEWGTIRPPARPRAIAGPTDRAREPDRHDWDWRRELEQARSELDRLRAEAQRWREQAEPREVPGSPDRPPVPATDATGTGEGRDLRGDFEIPGYQVLGKLREGAMSTVYKARQVSVDRIVAIKVLRDALAHDKEHIRRFWCEAINAAKLSHPHVITTIDAGEVDGHPFLVMEYVEGETIQDHLDRRRRFSEPAAIEIALAVAEALRHDLRRGLIHRDVKPANVILTPDGGIKLADLGLARPTGDEGWALAEAGMAIGTPEYISPEQVRGQVDVDIRSDLYSLGATLYHMVTGRVPYGGETTPEALRRHVDPRTPLVPPEMTNPEITRGLGAVIGKMMARSREDRYRHPDDLILDLECLRRGGRPLIAEPSPDALATLAVGDPVGGRSGHGHREGAAGDTEDAPVMGLAGEATNWGILIVLSTLLLAVALLIAVVFLVAL